MNLKQLIKEAYLKFDDCNCGKSVAPLINESKKHEAPISEALRYHVENKLPITENIFRAGSLSHVTLLLETRQLVDKGIIVLNGKDKWLFENTDLGYYGEFEGKMVPLDLPMVEENTDEVVAILNNPNIEDDVKSMLFNAYKSGKLSSEQVIDIIKKTVKEHLNEAEYQGKEVQLGKPKRGGAKKFYVYVKNPKTKKVKKVSFGAAGGGLRAKLNNSKARQAFSKRMNCPQAKDKTKAKYWACRLPKFAKLLGFKTTFTGYW